MNHLECCPVCHGKGIVPCGFYVASGMGATSSTADEPCRSCSGCGYMLVHESLPTIAELRPFVEALGYSVVLMKTKDKTK